MLNLPTLFCVSPPRLQDLAVLEYRRRMKVARAGHAAGEHVVLRGWVEIFTDSQ